METVLLSDSIGQLEAAAQLIKDGEVVGIPTETVYGLGADASNEAAVRKIFAAKGRPADNPLIVHLADFYDAVSYTKNIPALAYRLAEKFCPGPFTMILPKNERIPYVTSGGLETVGIRIPSHPVMHRIIELSGCPIAAPSANISGYPSPTSAQHVMDDMMGKIAAVVDGGQSEFGLESTVAAIENENTVRILRPGCVTAEQLKEICENVIIDKAILNDIGSDEKVPSPGMKYKHYSPKADIVLVESSFDDFVRYVGANDGEKVYSLIFDGDAERFPYKFLAYGDNDLAQAHNVFQKLRELDEIGAEKVYVRAPSSEGVGLAVYNRLIRAAGFEVIRI
ncbi:MAG: threonylcarbamoyl-AMP synthase [Ruminococcus sp.]|nr:threonylcarbamoyl-AMP synthase [Ruminococcus sp.]